MFKRALISVSQKEGLIEFLRPLVAQGMELVSTGGTAQFLKEQGWAVTDVSDVTKFPEVLDGRVKTLHPFIHMGLLAKKDSPAHQQTLKDWDVKSFDLVVGNLYPFEKAVQANSTEDELIEKIDIGGPSFLRSAAKNFSKIAIVCDPKDYEWIQKKNYQLDLNDHKRLAAQVFRVTSCYDQLIASQLDDSIQTQFSFAGKLKQTLRYGENDHQPAWWFENTGLTSGLSLIQQLGGKELSYNNLLDLDSAFGLSKHFQSPTVVAVKHNNPCGVATAADPMVALKKALSSDPVSVFGGIVAVNFEITAEHSELLHSVFLECLLAPNYSSQALDILKSKKNFRILQIPKSSYQKNLESQIRTISGGFLIQKNDLRFSTSQDWKVLGQKPSSETTDDILFGEKVCAALKSNAIAIVGLGQTLGLGMGQVNRVDAVEQAISRWKKHHPSQKNAVLVSDAFFPFPDSIQKCADAGISWVVQPGGSVKDAEVIAMAEKLKVNLVMTGIRHFRH